MRERDSTRPDEEVPLDPMGLVGTEDLARINRQTEPILDEMAVDVTVADRSTPPSGLTSGPMIFPDEPQRAHEQAGVSPGNADAESDDWDHLGG
ncbi:hypothetical protein D3C87_615440 [compost metagenome]